MKIIFNYKYIKRMAQEMVIRLLYKDVEEIVSSKVIITKGGLVNAYKIEIAGKDR